MNKELDKATVHLVEQDCKLKRNLDVIYEAKIEESEKGWQSQSQWLPGVQLRHFSPTCAVHIEDCEGWWLSGCRSSVAEHWLYKPGVLGLIPGDCRPFHFPLSSPHNIKISL